MKIRFALCSIITVLVFLMGATHSYGQANLMQNGGFEDGVLAPWSIYGTNVTSEIMNSGAVEGRNCLKIITVKGANFWDAGLQHNAGKYTFQKDKKYTLAIFLKSPNKLKINFKPELGADPWTGYGSKEFTMTDSWVEYSITTPVFADDVAPGTITFHIAYDVGEIYADGGRFFEGDYVAPPTSAIQPQSKLSTVWGKMKAE